MLRCQRKSVASRSAVHRAPRSVPARSLRFRSVAERAETFLTSLGLFSATESRNDGRQAPGLPRHGVSWHLSSDDFAQTVRMTRRCVRRSCRSVLRLNSWNIGFHSNTDVDALTPPRHRAQGDESSEERFWQGADEVV